MVAYAKKKLEKIQIFFGIYLQLKKNINFSKTFLFPIENPRWLPICNENESESEKYIFTKKHRFL